MTVLGSDNFGLVGTCRDVSGVVSSVLDGYNACIFAYGQTGSGKCLVARAASWSMHARAQRRERPSHMLPLLDPVRAPSLPPAHRQNVHNGGHP